MLSSAETHLREAVSAAQADGLGREVFVNMATELYDNAAPTPEGGSSPTPDTGEVIYDELPAGLIDVPTAVREYSISRSTLSTWRRQGKLHRRGRLRAAAPGGGYNVFSREDVQRLISAPVNKGGRPKKRGHTA